MRFLGCNKTVTRCNILHFEANSETNYHANKFNKRQQIGEEKEKPPRDYRCSVRWLLSYERLFVKPINLLCCHLHIDSNTTVKISMDFACIQHVAL